MTARKPFKRYKDAKVVTAESGFTVELDGRRIRTPKATAFMLPSRGLAEAIAREWQGQGDHVDPRTMPLTGLANAALDHISAEPSRFVDQIVSYAANDLLCYRAETPPSLIARQAELWDPLIAWAADRFDASLVVVPGVMPREQPKDAIAALRAAFEAQSPFALAGLFSAVTLTGSAVLGLALAHGQLDAAKAWEASRLDEIVQAEAWGQDEEAVARSERMGAELAQAERFLVLLAAS